MSRHALRRGLTLTLVSLVIAVSAAPATALAGSAVDPSTLTPPPPSPYACHGIVGAQIHCDFNLLVSVDPFPTGLVCGSGAGAFEVWDGGESIRIVARREFDPQGRITRRIVHETYLGASFVNHTTGASVRYTQSNTTVDDYRVPGDLASTIEATTGNAAIFLMPGAGAILINAGRTEWVFDPAIDDLALISSRGPQAFVRAFVDGDPTVFDPLCEALAG